MDNENLLKLWKKEEDAAFSGWNFSRLDGRWDEENLPWDYKNIIHKYLKPEDALLDMGTGGGEFLLSLKHPFNKTSVTEMWEPNFKLCMQKLSPLGINLQKVVNDNNLPFPNKSFDLIINRHESFSIKEVKRILKPGGIFITQQVGAENNKILSEKLVKDFKTQYRDNNLKDKVQEFQNSLFEIEYKKEFFPYLRFYDVGALVYFAKIIEWEFPGFTVDNSLNQLYKLHKELDEKSYIESLEHRFILVAKDIKQD